jgi:NitT/TauT family transport system permease protein
MSNVRTRPALGRLTMVGLPVAGVLLLLAGWWLATEITGVQTFVVPAPPDVAEVFNRMPGRLLHHVGFTLAAVGLGYGLGVAAGVVMAVLVTSSRVIERMFMPLLIGLNAVPKIAIAPLLVFWMGFGIGPKVTVVVLMCFFPVVISTVAGLTSTPAEMGELAKALDASRLRTFLKVRVPWALPQIFVGLKIAITLAVTGAVVGEFVGGGSDGLGYAINAGSATADTPLAFAGMALLVLISVLLFYAVVILERLLLPWARETTG